MKNFIFTDNRMLTGSLAWHASYVRGPETDQERSKKGASFDLRDSII